MNSLVILLYLSLSITCILIGVNFLIYLYLNLVQNYKRKTIKKYEKDILDYTFQHRSKEDFIRLSTYKSLKRGYSMSLFLEKIIEIINLINGAHRKSLINLCEEMNISNKLIKKFNHPFTGKIEKELLLYQIGELRSKKQLDYFLNFDRAYIKKYDLYRGYFSLVNNIVNEWIYELEDSQINKYIDLVFNIIGESKDSKNLNTKKLFEIFLTDTSSLFRYIIQNDNTRKYIINSLIRKEIPLSYKGEILYIMVLNFEYRINNFIKKEFSKYINNDDLTHDQLNYLIFLIKSLGEMGLQDAYNSFRNACKNKNWTIRAIGAKYLYKYKEKESFYFLEEFLKDSSWWVRKNAALSLDRLAYEGIDVLVKTLNSQDKFAKEISAYTLSSGSYFFYFKEKLLKENKYLDGFHNLLTTNFGRVFLERILLDNDISSKHKINIIKDLKYSNYEDYFITLLSREKLSKEIENSLEDIYFVGGGGFDERIS